MSSFYVYAYIDPENPGDFKYGSYTFSYEPYYIGKGSGRRMYNHFRDWDLKKSKNKLKVNKITKILRAGFNILDYIIVIEKNLCEEAAFRLEKEMVSLIGIRIKDEGPLTNMTYGGDGCAGPQQISNEKKLEVATNNLIFSIDICCNIIADYHSLEVSTSDLALKYGCSDDTIISIIKNKLFSLKNNEQFQTLYKKYGEASSQMIKERRFLVGAKKNMVCSDEQIGKIFEMFCDKHMKYIHTLILICIFLI